MTNNPFTLMFGLPSNSLISRDDSLNEIITNFNNDVAMYAYIITGIRGCGKTVLLREACKKLSMDNNWIIVDINSQSSILESLTSKLYDASKVRKMLNGWSLSINLPYFTLKKEHQEITDSETILEHIIDGINKEKKKILISIDEVTNTSEFRKFVNFYQSMIGKGYKLYLLMTGLNENINSIINDKAMTFLSRLPKIELEPLDLVDISFEYKSIFDIDNNEAIKMAKLTRGYAFAYQVLGYFFFELKNKGIDEKLLNRYQRYLWTNGYTKFWNDSTPVEKKFMIGLAKAENGSKEEIIKNTKISVSNYSQYRKRLIDKRLVVVNGWDKLEFSLPQFKEFVLYMNEFGL